VLKVHSKKILTLSLPALLVVAIADWLLGSQSAKNDYHSFRIPHPYFHHGFLPSHHAETEWGGTAYEIRTNDHGLRDASIRKIKPSSDSTRVLLMGDSFVEGMGLPYKDTLAGFLQADLAAKGIEILNGAAVSYSPKLYHLKTRFLVEHRKLRLDTVVAFIDISDIQDELNYTTFQPDYSFSHFLQESTPYSWSNQSFFARSLRKAKKRQQAPSNQFDFRRMADIDVWINNVDAYVDATDPKDVEKGRWEWTISPALFEDWGKDGLKLSAKHMRDLHSLCKQHNIALSIVVYPSPTQIFANDLNSLQVVFWKDFCNEEDIPFLNLFPSFINQRFRGPNEVYAKYFIPGDTHWNKDGHWMVANELIRLWDLIVPES